MSGYLRAQRDRFKHHLFRSEQFCRGYAWDWMCARACYAPRPYTVKGKTITVQRGQFVASPDEMAEAWNWSRSAVNRFLARLKTEHMIEHETGHGKSLITICNYEEYQSDTPQPGQESGQETGHKADTKRTAKEKEQTNTRNENTDLARFAEFWAVYPHRDGKRGRKPAEAKYRAAVKAGVPEQSIIAAARRYAGDSRVKAGFARDPTTWLNQAGWEDELGPQHLAPVNDSGAVDFWAAKLNDPAAFVPQTAITPSLAARLVSSGLVTPETLKRRGFAA